MRNGLFLEPLGRPLFLAGAEGGVSNIETECLESEVCEELLTSAVCISVLTDISWLAKTGLCAADVGTGD